jgi:amino acid transporter
MFWSVGQHPYRYAQLGEQVGGLWLNIWIVSAITVGCVGMYEADLSSGAFQLLGMAERGMLPKVLAQRSRFETPTYGIILASCIAWVCVIFSLQELIEMLNISYVLAAMLEIGAFLHLRWTRPDLHRPVRIPMSNIAVTLMMCPTVFFSIMVFRCVAYFIRRYLIKIALLLCASACGPAFVCH